MRRILAIVWIVLMASVGNASELKKLVFAPLPTQSQETIVEMFTPMVRYLEKSLHVSIEYRFSNSYAQMLASMEAGEIDIAYLGPLPYVEIHAKHPSYLPLVFFNESNKEPFYTCAIVSWDASKSLSRLTPKDRFALTDPLSTCGYFSVEGLLNTMQHSLVNQPFTYIGKHDTVALEVIKGNFEFGGLKSDIARQYGHLGLEVVAETALLPSFALIADTKKLSKEHTDAIVKALIEVEEKERLQWHKSIRHGVTYADDKAYDTIRRIQSESNKAIKAKQ